MRLLFFLLSLLAIATPCHTQSAQPCAASLAAGRRLHLRDFHFKSGETLPELRMHYLTFGKPARDANGRVTNAVLILHGTGGSGRQFLQPQFADVLFAPGQLLDTTKYFVILPDNIGHGKSSKPSDGLHAHFPQYDYDDMVLAQHDLLSTGPQRESPAPRSWARPWDACIPGCGARPIPISWTP